MKKITTPDNDVAGRVQDHEQQQGLRKHAQKGRCSLMTHSKLIGVHFLR